MPIYMGAMPHCHAHQRPVCRETIVLAGGVAPTIELGDNDVKGLIVAVDLDVVIFGASDVERRLIERRFHLEIKEQDGNASKTEPGNVSRETKITVSCSQNVRRKMREAAAA